MVEGSVLASRLDPEGGRGRALAEEGEREGKEGVGTRCCRRDDAWVRRAERDDDRLDDTLPFLTDPDHPGTPSSCPPSHLSLSTAG